MRTTTITQGRRRVEVTHLETRYFEVDGKEYEIVGTASTGQGAEDCEHRVKGETETKTVKHSTLVKLFKAGKLQTIKKKKR